MTRLTTAKLEAIARESLKAEPTDYSNRARHFFACVVGSLPDAEADRLALAMGFPHLTNAASREAISRLAATTPDT
jgi:hypothetical protein